ncbi:MAG: hypothetical protein FWH22_06205, partial [Fibromonadales bacterium]|nr:hypothetical protein [Fibromonadales bacterium]
NDESLTWDAIVGTLKHPAAYITVVHSIANQSCYVQHGSRRLISQNGYNSIGSGENEVFEVESSDEGAQIQLRVVCYGESIQIPVLEAGETDPPIIQNGYNYSVSVIYTAGDGGIQNANNYKATLLKGEERDLSEQLESL